MIHIKNIFGHFWTVTRHKYYVCIECFKVGLYWQGLIHDLSKYSPSEFIPSVKYFQGYKSPIGVQRREEGFSKAWVHHVAQNKHHFQHWLDIPEKGEIIPVEMPYKYALELVCDSIGAAKVYKGENFHNGEPLRHWREKVDKRLMHPKTAELLESFFENYAETGKILSKKIG